MRTGAEKVLNALVGIAAIAERSCRHAPAGTAGRGIIRQPLLAVDLYDPSIRMEIVSLVAISQSAGSTSCQFRSRRGCVMEVPVKVPTAFSVRDENEFYAFQHLLARMNSRLHVTPVATGVHVNGGCTVFWGLVHDCQEKLTKECVEAALRDAGFDFKRCAQLNRLDAETGGVANRTVLSA
jgi:hypothetical protein